MLKLYLLGGAALVFFALSSALAWKWNESAANATLAAERGHELKVRDTEDLADNTGRAAASAGQAQLQRRLEDFIRENALAPVSAACANDPAFARAYGVIGSMSDDHENALRDAPGRTAPALQTP